MDTRREVEVDTALAEIWSKTNAAQSRKENLLLTLARHAGFKPVYVTKTRREVQATKEEIFAGARAAAASTVRPWDAQNAQNALDSWDATTAEITALRAEAAPLEDEFAAKPWSRFFLVQNSNGHIHSSMHCSTCTYTTSFAWLPSLSGLTEKDAVDAHGPLLCSVCYPSAPVEWTTGPVKDTSSECPGSRSYDKVQGTEKRYYTGNGRAKCSHCEQFVGTTTTGKLRAHKPA